MPACLTCTIETFSTINIGQISGRFSPNQSHPLCENCKERWIYYGEAALLRIGNEIYYDCDYLTVFPIATGHCMELVTSRKHLIELSRRVTQLKIDRIRRSFEYDRMSLSP